MRIKKKASKFKINLYFDNHTKNHLITFNSMIDCLKYGGSISMTLFKIISILVLYLIYRNFLLDMLK